MPVPTIVPRAEHRISRRDIDPDALKVLYRLHEHQYAGYLVGGSVRDLLLGRRPKDFDIGTDAHPYQVKKLFRNCWIIGRRFRLAHVKYGPKTIEVATFRRLVPESEIAAAEAAAAEQAQIVASSPTIVHASHHTSGHGGHHTDQHGIVHRDNTFGTPEEDAFRRDFTINGLFYDIGTFSVIDYVGGLADLQARIVRSIGDPLVRFVEDPVRMLRAVVMASRLTFDLDPLVVEAIAEHRGLIAKASPARLLEEYYKILRSGCAEATFRALKRARLLELMTPELKSPPEALWEWLAKLDRYRLQFASAPPELTNTILSAAFLVPTGILDKAAPAHRPAPSGGRRERAPVDRIDFGLPVARRDLERLRHVRQLLPRMADPTLSPRLESSIVHRPAFVDALIWLEVYGDSPELIERWQHAAVEHGVEGSDEHGHPPIGADAPEGDGGADRPRRRRRRGRRRGRGGSGAGPGGSGTGGGPA